MAITRWNPISELQDLQKRMNKLMGEPEKDEMTGFERGEWYPSVDIFEQDDEVVLKAELPGMDKDDIEVSVEDNVLTLKGNRSMEKEVEESDYQRIERAYGSFTRSFTLPRTVDAEDIEASYDDGLLKVSLGKKPEAKSKTIDIS